MTNYSLELIREDEETCLRVYRIGTCYHVVSYSDRNAQVYSVVPNDNTPPEAGGSAWCGNITPYGVEYVSAPRSRANAFHWFRTLRDRYMRGQK